MKLRDCFVIACRNISANKKIVCKMIIGQVTILTMIISFTIMYLSYKAYKDNFDEKSFALCYYSLSDTDADIGDLPELAESIRKTKGYDEVWCYNYVWYNGYPCEECEFLIDDKKYTVVKYDGMVRAYSPERDIIKKDSYINIGAAFKGGSVIPEVLGGNEKAVIAGTYPVEKSQVLLDDYLLEHIGYEGDYESLIGKSISGSCIPKGSVISGVACLETIAMNKAYVAHIIRYPEDGEKFVGCMRGYYSDIERFTQKTKHYDIVNGDDSAEVSGKGFEYCMIHWIMTDLGKLLVFICGVIILIMLFSIGYLINFYRDNRAAYLRMLSCIGMTRKDGIKIVFLEHNMYFISTIIFGWYFALIIMLIFKSVVVSLFDFAVVLSVWPFVFGTLGLWLVMNVMVYMIVIRKNVSV